MSWGPYLQEAGLRQHQHPSSASATVVQCLYALSVTPILSQKRSNSLTYEYTAACWSFQTSQHSKELLWMHDYVVHAQLINWTIHTILSLIDACDTDCHYDFTLPVRSFVVGWMHELVRVGSVTLADSPMLSSHHSHACILVAALAHECLLLCLAHSNACRWLTHMVVECPAYNWCTCLPVKPCSKVRELMNRLVSPVDLPQLAAVWLSSWVKMFTKWLLSFTSVYCWLRW